MTQDDARLSQISTIWTQLEIAHHGEAAEAAEAQRLILGRYAGAIHRYLWRVAGDAATADDLAQEFALALVRGDFHRVAPARGRFRDYLKTCLVHMVRKQRHKQSRLPRTLAEDNPALRDLSAEPDAPDEEFDRSWRAEILERTWNALAAAQPRLHAMLRFRAAFPELSSADIAARFGPSLTAAAARQAVKRARDLFAELLLEEVAATLRNPTREALGRELADLNLLSYCRSAFERFGRETPVRG